MTEEEFWALTPFEWELYLDHIGAETKRRSKELATVLATIYNTAGKSYEKTVEPNDLLKDASEEEKKEASFEQQRQAFLALAALADNA